MEAARGLEGDVDLHLGLAVDDTLLVVKFETLIQDFLNFSGLDLRHTFVVGLHLKLDVQVAVGLVGDVDRKGLAETNSDRSEIQLLRADLDLAIVARTNNLN